jgi:hypothetical protein
MIIAIIVMWICKVSVMNNGDDLRLNIYVCYTWDMALNVGLDVSFDKI